MEECLGHEWIEVKTKLSYTMYSSVGLCSHLVPEHGARVRFSLDTDVNPPFLQVLTQEFASEYKVSTLGARTRRPSTILA